MEHYDLVVLGGGPGGYIAALRGAILGMKVACIEKHSRLGGTCLNVGCIPSKALLYSSELYHKLKNEGKEHGINASGITVDLTQMMKRKEGIIADLGKGIDYLFNKRQIVWIQGEGEVALDHVKVGDQQVGFKHLILATGSTPIELPNLPFDEKVILSSTGALTLTEVPKKMVLIGAGVIGLELGSVYARLGAEIEVIEMMDRAVSSFDLEISHALVPIFQKEGFTFHFKTKVEALNRHQGGISLVLDTGAQVSGDCVLVAVGRRPLIPPGLSFALTPSGQIKVNDRFQTSHPNIYAIGDLIDGPMLAHKASEEGMVLVDALAGRQGMIDYLSIPNVMYTWPEVATVGLTEQRAKELKLSVRTGKGQFKANPRSRCNGETSGFVKVIADAQSERLLGVHILGATASEMIGEAVVCLKQKMSVRQLAQLPHAHPTLAEGLKEAAFACLNESLHG